MSVIAVKQGWTGESNDIATSGKDVRISSSMPYTVLLDTPATSEDEVRGADGLPQWGDPNPKNGYQRASGIRCAVGQSPLIWRVDVRYETPPGFDPQNPQPIEAQPNDLEWGSERQIRDAYRDIINKTLITNSAGDLLDPPAVNFEIIPVARFSRNELTFANAKIDQYVGLELSGGDARWLYFHQFEPADFGPLHLE